MAEEQFTIEKQIGSSRFCISPAVQGLGGACVYKLAAGQKNYYFLVLEVLPLPPSVFDEEIKPQPPKFKTVELPRDLAKEYVARPPNDPPSHYDGTLFLCVESCSVTNDGYITK